MPSALEEIIETFKKENITILDCKPLCPYYKATAKCLPFIVKDRKIIFNMVCLKAVDYSVQRRLDEEVAHFKVTYSFMDFLEKKQE